MKVVDVKIKTGDNQFVSILLDQYQDKELQYNFDLTPSGWQETSGSTYSTRYYQTVNITGIAATTEGVVGISQNATTEQYKAAGKASIRCVSQTDNTLVMGADKISHLTEGSGITIPCHITGVYTPRN